MPDQKFWRDKRGSRPAVRVRFARWALLLSWFGAVGAFAWALYRVLSVEPPTSLQLIFWVLSTICFAWVAVGSLTALIGFLTLIANRSVDTIALVEQARPPQARTALLFPVYREDPSDVSRTIATMCRDLVASGGNATFDVFILSDTQSEHERLAERRIYTALQKEFACEISIYMRWRSPNAEKKAGNIRDWVQRFGSAYAYFIILDADSIMSAQAMLQLAATIDAHPRVGLIQTVPRLAGGLTLFARLQQFASCYYGSLLATGLAAWHGPGGNYWGHNAIIRTSAFASSAGLSQLPGAAPLGGHILSHDFVEAALLRRAGWEVHMAPSVAASYEGCPPSLGDLIARDRRWAQGNLQHLRLLGASGLPSLSRLHLAMGAFSYLASPIWAATLVIGVVLAFQAKYATPTYFGETTSLFPRWPVFNAQLALTLFLATVAVVHLPKVLGGLWAVRNSAARKANGGVGRIAGGILIESIAATLIAPVLMITQTAAVASIAMGRDAGWGAQRRIAADAPLADFFRRYAWQMGWGAVGCAICLAISPAVLAWMSPIVLGLMLAGVTASLASRKAPPPLNHLLAATYDRDIPPILAAHANLIEKRQQLPA
jgi:membrane glycosyltransferase